MGFQSALIAKVCLTERVLHIRSVLAVSIRFDREGLPHLANALAVFPLLVSIRFDREGLPHQAGEVD